MSARATLAVLVGASALHVLLTWVALPGWVCPFRAATGMPCPGCGLTRGLIELLRGHPVGALAQHPFAPLAFGAGVLAVVLVALPDGRRRRAVEGLSEVNRRIRGTWWLAGGILIHWATRLSDVGWWPR